MKKTFLAKRNTFLSSTDVSWGILTLVGVFMVLFVRIGAPNFFLHTFTPVFQSADALAKESHYFLQSFGTTATRAVQNEQLADENAALASENQALSQKIKDISALFSSQPTGHVSPGILAGVVARPPESPYDTLVLSVGTNEGVALGQEVFGSGGVPLGVVSSVLADFSRITLFSAPNMAIAGWVGDNSVPLTITGAGAGAMNAVIARSASIAVGDTVFVPGPGQLPIGIVTRIDSEPSSPSITLRIQPLRNLFSLAWVLVRTTSAPLFPPKADSPSASVTSPSL